MEKPQKRSSKKDPEDDTFPIQFFIPPNPYIRCGKLTLLANQISTIGSSLLLVCGRQSFEQGPFWPLLQQALAREKIGVNLVRIQGEPTPGDIDKAVDQYRDKRIDVVAAIGGGSVLDGGKAISAMITKDESVTSFLEGVGHLSHDGKKLPFFALPTTSGTGSEATKNAVISQPGQNGFKKSLRHDNFIPNLALVDPELTLDCPGHVTAACGMDALTQLLESYVSPQASPITDALCLSGLKGFGQALTTAILQDPKNIQARTRLSYGAYISGLTLANAGLGTVHGFASVIGGMANIPHGVVCGTLLAETTKATIDRLKHADPAHPGLGKYARAARYLDIASATDTDFLACNKLVDTLFNWTEKFKMPFLGEFGITQDQLEPMADNIGQKNNPLPLTRQTLAEILKNRI